MKKVYRHIQRLLFIILILMLMTGATDYWRTIHSFEKPIFAQVYEGADDGGSGRYFGIGYYIDIEGNFMSLDEFPGVTEAKFMLFGIEIQNVLRD